MSDRIRLEDEQNAEPRLSRRAFLGRAAALGGVSVFLAACGGGESGNQAGTESGAAAGGESGVVAAECEGYDQLTEQALQTRQTLGYVDVSPQEGKYCHNCRFYNQPEGGAACGGCQLFPGPVAPNGYCNSWAAVA